MDDVPVKIVERYKPPPIVYQLPQTIANRLATQDPNYYNESPQFNYDFQLERKVLSQVQCWRQMRQRENEARQERQERRKLERQRAMEAQQKEMLGAVQYPNTEDFSSSSSLGSDDDDVDREGDNGDGDHNDNNIQNEDESRAPTTTKAKPESSEIAAAAAANTINTKSTDNVEKNPVKKSINSNQTTSNFHNILQPTVLKQQIVANLSATATKKNVSLNYADFEYDNSSPFDNIELNTINDLDILAQVLHNTQLEQIAIAKVDQIEKTPPSLPALAEVQNYNENPIEEGVPPPPPQGVDASAAHLAVLAANKADLEKIDFNSLNQCDDVVVAANIPNNTSSSSNSNNTNNSTQQIEQQTFSNSLNQYHNYSAATTTATSTVASQPQPQPFQQLQHHASQSIQAYHIQQTNAPQIVVPHFLAAQYCDYQQQQQQHGSNQNYLFTPYCNGHSSSQPQPQHHNYITYHGTPTHQQLQQNQTSHNEYMSAQSVLDPVMAVNMLESAALKSKSVPDIMRELKSELSINTELKRSRNLSHNVDDEHSHKELTTTAPSSLPKSVYTELTVPARKLAHRISTMGFPLERVAKVVNICGIDDKKIIEHLIHLSELMDLGFEEAKISAALLKFDNNKDKALDYLIS